LWSRDGWGLAKTTHAAEQIVGPEPREAPFASSVVRLSCSVAPWPGQLNRYPANQMKRTLLLLLPTLMVLICSSVSAQKITHDELVDILDIKSWRLPMPTDEKWEWGIDFVDYAPRKSAVINLEKLTTKRKALIVLRDVGHDTYRFTLKQTAGTSSGDMEITICTEQEIKAKHCENSYVMTWFDEPKAFDDGTKFVIAEIAHMVRRKPLKQIILVPRQYRL
jgi:hypothetical protein